MINLWTSICSPSQASITSLYSLLFSYACQSALILSSNEFDETQNTGNSDYPLVVSLIGLDLITLIGLKISEKHRLPVTSVKGIFRYKNNKPPAELKIFNRILTKHMNNTYFNMNYFLIPISLRILRLVLMTTSLLVVSVLSWEWPYALKHLLMYK